MQQYFKAQSTDGPSDTVGAIAIDKNGNGASAMEVAKAPTDYFEFLFGKSMSALIVIDRNGNLGDSQTAPKLAFGWVYEKGNIKTAMHSNELLKT